MTLDLPKDVVLIVRTLGDRYYATVGLTAGVEASVYASADLADAIHGAARGFMENEPSMRAALVRAKPPVTSKTAAALAPPVDDVDDLL